MARLLEGPSPACHAKTGASIFHNVRLRYFAKVGFVDIDADAFLVRNICNSSAHFHYGRGRTAIEAVSFRPDRA